MISDRTNPFQEIYRSCNAGTNESKYQLIKDGIVNAPRYIDIELTNCCNFRCCFCPTGTGAMKRTKGFMQDEVVDVIIDNIKKYAIPAVRLIRWGEPTIHPKFIEIVEKLKAAGVKVHVNTNGSSLSDEIIEKLIELELDSIKISFQGADEGTYNEMREGGDYINLLNAVRKLHMSRGNRVNPYIQISTTLTGETVEQISSFKKDIDGYCDYYNIGYTMLNHLNVDSMKIDDLEKEKIRELQKHENLNRKYLEVCNEAFDKLSINWNGDVTLCCSDYDNFMILGNILDTDIQKLFLSRAADNYRKIIVNGQWGKIMCCSTCYDIIPLNS